MHTVRFALVLLLSPLGACVLADERGSGRLAHESRSAAPFHGFEASGAVEVRWRPGAPAITVTADDNLIAHLKTEVDGGLLRIHTDRGNLSWSRMPVIELHSPSLDRMGASGASTLQIDALSGTKLAADLSGASRLEARGHVEQLTLDVSGASRLALDGLAVDEATVHASGACSGEIRAARRLAAHLSGASHLSVRGNPPEVTRDLSGASSIDLR